MPEVRNAMAAGAWTPSILDHALECELCREVWIADYLHQQAHLEALKPMVLNADVLWWKAQLQENRRRSERAATIILAAQIFALLAGVVTLFKVTTLLLMNPDDQLLLRSHSPVVAASEAVATILFTLFLAIHAPRIGRCVRLFAFHLSHGSAKNR
jgi:hypothetical protein